MRRFDYSFLDHGLLPARLLNLSAGIVSLKVMAGVRKREQLRIFTELEQLAKIQSVKSSNAMEGIVTGDDRIVAIVNQNSTPLDHNEAEIAGYRAPCKPSSYRSFPLQPSIVFRVRRNREVSRIQDWERPSSFCQSG